MAALNTLILVSLLFFVAALLGGLTFAGLRALALWRSFQGFRDRLEAELEKTNSRVSGIESRLGGMAGKAETLEAAVARLRRSFATVLVLARAAGAAKLLVGRVRALRSEQMTRVGAIDIGTNSTRLLIADVEEGEPTEVTRRSSVTRLGEGVDAAHLLLPEPISRVHGVLDDYLGELQASGAQRTLAVATSAVRDAVNGRAFIDEIEARYGFPARILSGDEEGRLTRRGVGALDAGTLLLDVGGGSTELMLGEYRTSLDIGSVRLTERFLHSDPPTLAELAAAAGCVRALLPELAVSGAIGVAGTVTQLHERIGSLTIEAIENELGLLTAIPTAERARLARMDPLRAPVIVAGTIIVLEVLRCYSLRELGWSVRDLLDGVALEAAAMLPPDRETHRAAL